MNASRKIALSLLFTTVLSVAFALLAFTSLFSVLETRFYDPAVTAGIRAGLDAQVRVAENYFDESRGRFAAVLALPATRSSFSLYQKKEDIYERSRVLGLLRQETPGLRSVRFVDLSGRRIFYSTDAADILRRTGDSVAYRNYDEVEGYAAPDAAFASESGGIAFDAPDERLLFYLPFYDSLDVRRGTAVFSLSARAVAARLLGEAGLKTRDSLSLIAEPRGILSGLPESGAERVKEHVAALWRSGATSLSLLEGGAGGSRDAPRYVLLSEKTRQGIFVGALNEERLFLFPPLFKGVLLGCAVFTLFIVFFLLLNLRQDPVALIQSRLKSLQVRLIEEYYEVKGEMDWEKWRRELERRRGEIRAELRRGIRAAPGSETDRYIDSFFNASWDDLLAAVGQRGGPPKREEEKLEDMLKRILDAAGALLPAYAPPAADAPAVPPPAAVAAPPAENAPPPASAPRAQPAGNVADAANVGDTGEVEEAEAVEDVEEVEEFEDAPDTAPPAPAAPAPVAQPAPAADERAAWAALARNERDKRAAQAKERLAEAVMGEIRERRQTEAARAAYPETPRILGRDPYPPPESEAAAPEDQAFSYGSLVVESPDGPCAGLPGAPKELEEIEELEEIGEIEAADEAELFAERGAYGRFMYGNDWEESVTRSRAPGPDEPEEMAEVLEDIGAPDDEDDGLPAAVPAGGLFAGRGAAPPDEPPAGGPDVEDFEEVSDDDLRDRAPAGAQAAYMFTESHAAPPAAGAEPPPSEDDSNNITQFDMDISSPVDLMFAKDIVPAKKAVHATLNAKDEALIEERGGVHYIATGSLSRLNDAQADPALKTLVNKVLS